MSILLRYFAVAILVVAAVLVLSICGEGAGVGCAHACCGGADRPSALSRFFRRLAGAHASVASLGLILLALASRVFELVLAEFVPTPALLRASSLRI